MKNKFSLRLGVAVALAVFGLPAMADDRRITLIVPSQAGGTTDKIARLVGERVESILSAKVLVINKAGASGTIAIADVARAVPDGSTLGIVFDAHAVNHHIFKKLPYDTFKSFDYITMLVSAPHALVVSKNTPYRSFKQLIATARSQPDKVSFGSLGAGTSNHLYPMLLGDKAGAKFLPAPYTGTGGTFLADLLEGRFDFAMGSLPFVKPYLETGQLRILAYGGAERAPQLQQVETVGETFPGFEAASWVGVVAPKGVPAAKLRELGDAFNRALTTEPLKSRLLADGYVIEALPPQRFEQKVHEESERLAPLVATQQAATK